MLIYSTNANFPENGTELLRDAIVKFIGDQAAGGVAIGETLYHQRFPEVLYKTSGVLDFDVQLGTDPDNLQEQNIEVDSRSKVVTEKGMVTVL